MRTIAEIHAAADFEELRAQSANMLRDIQQQLDNVRVALLRPEPKIQISREIVEQVSDSIVSQLRKLELLK